MSSRSAEGGSSVDSAYMPCIKPRVQVSTLRKTKYGGFKPLLHDSLIQNKFQNLKSKKPALVAHTCSLEPGRQRQADVWEFEVSLVYRAGFCQLRLPLRLEWWRVFADLAESTGIYFPAATSESSQSPQLQLEGT